MSDLSRVKRTKGSNVKMSYSTFKAFKFPDRDNLHLKCTVLICLSSCSLVSDYTAIHRYIVSIGKISDMEYKLS